MDCVGYLTNDEMILSYVERNMEIARAKGAPLFTLSSATTVSHDDWNAIQVVDNTYASFLRRIIDKGYLDNSILIFMGDHGYRYGALRETLIGYYEDKLPNMWIRLPPALQQKFPSWQEALEINAKYEHIQTIHNYLHFGPNCMET
jgi:membrane-anchored protein YejM (alkaline phosphatase superfamily)